jgi:hypothetical protein
MQVMKVMTWAKFQLVQPLGESSKTVGFGLLFGMMPILIAWLILVLFGLFSAQYKSALIHGDVLMIATSLAGPAMIAIFRKRDPETIGQPEIVGSLGLLLTVVCALVFAVVNTTIVSTDFLASKLTLKVDIIRISWMLLALSTLYALYIEFHEARSGSLIIYRTIYAKEQHSIETNLSFPGGQ